MHYEVLNAYISNCSRRVGYVLYIMKCVITSGINLFSGLGRGKSGLGGGGNQDWGGAKSDHGAKTVYVYLLTSIILYKHTAYFGWGGGE